MKNYLSWNIFWSWKKVITWSLSKICKKRKRNTCQLYIFDFGLCQLTKNNWSTEKDLRCYGKFGVSAWKWACPLNCNKFFSRNLSKLIFSKSKRRPNDLSEIKNFWYLFWVFSCRFGQNFIKFQNFSIDLIVTQSLSRDLIAEKKSYTIGLLFESFFNFCYRDIYF